MVEELTKQVEEEEKQGVKEEEEQGGKEQWLGCRSQGLEVFSSEEMIMKMQLKGESES